MGNTLARSRMMVLRLMVASRPQRKHSHSIGIRSRPPSEEPARCLDRSAGSVDDRMPGKPPGLQGLKAGNGKGRKAYCPERASIFPTRS